MKLQIGDREFDVNPAGETITVGDKSFAIRVVRNTQHRNGVREREGTRSAAPSLRPDEGRKSARRRQGIRSRAERSRWRTPDRDSRKRRKVPAGGYGARPSLR